MKTRNNKWLTNSLVTRLVDSFTENHSELAHETMTDVEQKISDLVNSYVETLDQPLEPEIISVAKDVIKTSIRKVIATELLSNEFKGETLNTF